MPALTARPHAKAARGGTPGAVLLRRDLPDDATAVRVAISRERAAVSSCAVEIAIAVDYYVPDRKSSVGAAGEVVKAGITPETARVGQFENRTVWSMCAAGGRRAVQVADCVHSQAAKGSRKVSTKTMEQAERPATTRGHQLKNRTGTSRATLLGRAIDIARGVQDQTSFREHSVASALKSVENILHP